MPATEEVAATCPQKSKQTLKLDKLRARNLQSQARHRWAKIPGEIAPQTHDISRVSCFNSCLASSVLLDCCPMLQDLEQLKSSVKYASCHQSLSNSTTLSSDPCFASLFLMFLVMSFENLVSERAIQILATGVFRHLARPGCISREFTTV